MSEPLVAAIMLTRDRPAMARRAVERFRRQTYGNKRLLIWNTGARLDRALLESPDVVLCEPAATGATIGKIRNEALDAYGEVCRYEIVVTFDDDDWSHPRRIAEQVALLQASGKQAVGYRECLFWRTGSGPGVARLKAVTEGTAQPLCPICGYHGCEHEGDRDGQQIGEAYLYHNADPRYCIGASLCYWRTAWEQQPFADLHRGEDLEWLKRVDSLGVSAMMGLSNPRRIPEGDGEAENLLAATADCTADPRLICGIHGANTCEYSEQTLRGNNFARVPQWDGYCRRECAL